MANLKNLHAFKNDTNGKRVTVGNNRQVSTTKGTTSCYLHGHEVVTLKRTPKGGNITLDHCGYQTVTTRQAMNDFMGGLGVNGRVSFAGGDFNARINGQDLKSTGNTISAPAASQPIPTDRPKPSRPKV